MLLNGLKEITQKMIYNMMNILLKESVRLALVAGIVYLMSNQLDGWGWLIFLFILTMGE